MNDFDLIAIAKCLSSVLTPWNDGVIQFDGNLRVTKSKHLQQVRERGATCQLQILAIHFHLHKELSIKKFNDWFADFQAGMRNIVHASRAQPARKATPPIGVIAPSQRIPVRLNTYRLPEKITMPARKR